LAYLKGEDIITKRTPELRKLFRIPQENEVQGAMIAGYPQRRFKRGIKRQLSNVSWISN